MSEWEKPWHQIDRRTGKPFHWSYSPTWSYLCGLVTGLVFVAGIWWLW